MMLSREVYSRNYDHHNGFPPQNIAADDLLVNDTMKHHRRYSFLHHVTDIVTNSTSFTTTHVVRVLVFMAVSFQVLHSVHL
jgi:hypothetical protein